MLIAAITVTADDNGFYNAFQSCTNYVGNGEISTDGSIAKYKTQILGWESDKCVYKEHVNYSGIEAVTTCRFSQRQVDELVDVMRAFSTVQKYSTEKLDTSSINNIIGNPVVNAWNKYLMDSSVCNIELSK